MNLILNSPGWELLLLHSRIALILNVSIFCFREQNFLSKSVRLAAPQLQLRLQRLRTDCSLSENLTIKIFLLCCDNRRKKGGKHPKIQRTNLALPANNWNLMNQNGSVHVDHLLWLIVSKLQTVLFHDSRFCVRFTTYMQRKTSILKLIWSHSLPKCGLSADYFLITKKVKKL